MVCVGGRVDHLVRSSVFATVVLLVLACGSAPQAARKARQYALLHSPKSGADAVFASEAGGRLSSVSTSFSLHWVRASSPLLFSPWHSEQQVLTSVSFPVVQVLYSYARSSCGRLRIR